MCGAQKTHGPVHATCAARHPPPPGPFVSWQEREEVGVSEWDRFARNEYMRLSMEDEAETDGADATASAWAADALAVEL